MENYNTLIPYVTVVVGVVRDKEDKVFIAKRPLHTTYPCYWEFPGGKIEVGETHEEALARELHEEIGIILKASTFLCEAIHSDTERTLHLFFYEVMEFEGMAHGAESQETAWVSIESLSDYTFPPANKPVLERLQF
jgi:8-oxo-dGTP diphosphatase